METLNNNQDDPNAGSESNHSQPPRTRDDKREHNIDANKSISQMREDAEKEKNDKLQDQAGEQENGADDDAMNYKSDRDNGSYNPENI